MRNKHSVGWHVAKKLTRKLNIQRAISAVLALMLVLLSVWFGFSGG